MDGRGLRGLVVTKPVQTGDLLLEAQTHGSHDLATSQVAQVPLKLTLADGCEGHSD